MASWACSILWGGYTSPYFNEEDSSRIGLEESFVTRCAQGFLKSGREPCGEADNLTAVASGPTVWSDAAGGA